MKTAQIAIVSVELVCPHCKETIWGPVSGSAMWDREDAQHAVQWGLECDVCFEDKHRKLRIPAMLRRLAV